MSPHRNNARLVAGTCVTIVLVALLILGGIATYGWGHSDGERDRGARTDELNGCRAGYRAQLVDLPVVAGLRAVASKDERKLNEALTKADEVKYLALLAKSQTDPAAFLEQCRRDNLGT